MSPPARSQQPSLGSGNHGAIGGRRRTLSPSLEPSARGRGVDPELGFQGSWGSLARMLSRVEEYIRKRGSHLAGRAERAVVIAAVENRSAPTEDAIHGPSEARGKALHPIRQSRDALRFDEQVDVIVLERVVDDAEVRASCDRAKRVLHLPNQAHRSQGRHVPANANRHQAGRRSGNSARPRCQAALLPQPFAQHLPSLHPNAPACSGAARAEIDASYT